MVSGQGRTSADGEPDITRYQDDEIWQNMMIYDMCWNMRMRYNQISKWWNMVRYDKLDGVGPVVNIPSTD